MEFDLENPLENFNHLHSNAVSSLFLIESDHTPSQNFLLNLKARDLLISVRTEVVSLISELSCALDPLLSYLAINYLDRFLAKQELLQPKPWVLRLLAVSCFSLAFKMIKTEYSVTDVQDLLKQSDGGIIFETQTIQRMEAVILGALEWRMRSITPFSFLPFFITLLKFKDPPMGQVLKNRATEIIFSSQREIKLWEVKPSIIAASALLCASHELLPFQYPSFFTAICDCSCVNKESMMQCYNVIQQDIAIEEEYGSVFNVNAVSTSVTPVTVLDHHFLTSDSEITNGITVNTSLKHEKDLKRRKITGYGNNPTVQISRVKPR